jgi:hypothetical protein
MKQLVILLLGFGVMFGVISPKKAFKRFGMMLIFSLMLALLWALISETWDNITFLEKIAVLAIGPIAILAAFLFGTRFGRKVLASMIGDFLYDTIKSVIAFPSKCLRLLLRRH